MRRYGSEGLPCARHGLALNKQGTRSTSRTSRDVPHSDAFVKASRSKEIRLRVVVNAEDVIGVAF